MFCLAARQFVARTSLPAVQHILPPVAFVHTPSSADYTAGFVSNPVRQELGRKDDKGPSLVVEDALAPSKWWAEPEAKAKFEEWGVDAVFPPAKTSVRESKFAGMTKYGPVTLQVRSNELKAEVAKQMTLFNRSKGTHQAFEVVVSPHVHAAGEHDATFVSATVRQEVHKVATGPSLVVEDCSAPEKWWEQDDYKAKFEEWGVSSVTPPAPEDLRDSKSTGLLKYGPVTLHVKSKDLEDMVTTQMTLFNRSKGMHQAFNVVS